MAQQQGWELRETILRLQFTDPIYDGLQVRAYEPPNEVVQAVATFADEVDGQLSPEERERAGWVVDQFAEALVDWNLRRRGKKTVPATKPAVRRLPQGFTWQLIAAWIGASKQAAQQQMEDSAADQQLPMETSTGGE